MVTGAAHTTSKEHKIRAAKKKGWWLQETHENLHEVPGEADGMRQDMHQCPDLGGLGL